MDKIYIEDNEYNSISTIFSSNKLGSLVIPIKGATTPTITQGEIAYDKVSSKLILSDGKTWKQVQGGGAGSDIDSIILSGGLTGTSIITTGTIYIEDVNSTPGTYINPNITVNSSGQITSITGGTIVNSLINIGTTGPISTLSGLPITTTGNFILNDSGVVSGTYRNPIITVDTYGRITGITEGLLGSVKGISVGTGLTSTFNGGNSGSVFLPDLITAGTYTNPYLRIDSYGRISGISSNPIPGAVLSIDGITGVTTSLTGGITNTGSVSLVKLLPITNPLIVLSPEISYNEKGFITNTNAHLPFGTLVGLSASNGVTNTPYLNGGLTYFLANSGVVANTYSYATVTVDQTGHITNAVDGSANVSNLITIAAGLGLTGATLTGGTGYFAMELVSGMTEDSFGYPNVSVNSFGQITSITGTTPGQILFVSAINGLTGGGFTVSGTVGLINIGVTHSTTNSTITIDQFGRVIGTTSNPNPAVSGVSTSYGITGGGNTGNLQISLATNGVISGTYFWPILHVNNDGRINSVIGSSSGIGTVFLVGTTNGLGSNLFTNTGTLALENTTTDVCRRSTNSLISVDKFGRLSAGMLGGVYFEGVSNPNGIGLGQHYVGDIFPAFQGLPKFSLSTIFNSENPIGSVVGTTAGGGRIDIQTIGIANRLNFSSDLTYDTTYFAKQLSVVSTSNDSSHLMFKTYHDGEQDINYIIMKNRSDVSTTSEKGGRWYQYCPRGPIPPFFDQFNGVLTGTTTYTFGSTGMYSAIGYSVGTHITEELIRRNDEIGTALIQPFRTNTGILTDPYILVLTNPSSQTTALPPNPPTSFSFSPRIGSTTYAPLQTGEMNLMIPVLTDVTGTPTWRMGRAQINYTGFLYIASGAGVTTSDGFTGETRIPNFCMTWPCKTI